MRLNLLHNHPGPCGTLLALAVAAVPVRADYQATVLSQGPVGYWRLNETIPPPAPPILATNVGSIGAAGNGTYILATRGVKPGAIVSEPGEGAVEFNGVAGSTNRVRIPFANQWNPTGPLSVEFWAKPAQTGAVECPAASVEFIQPPLPPAAQIPTPQRNGWLFYQGDSNVLSTNALLVTNGVVVMTNMVVTTNSLITGNGWVFRQYNSSGLTNLTLAGVNLNLDTNQWYHVVGVFDGTNMSIFVNGVLGATTNFVGTPRANTNSAIPLTFGARADGAAGDFAFSGLMDEAAVYDAALSPARILAHYQAGTNVAPSTPYSQVVLADSPAGYWRFNEPSDPPAANLGTLGAAGTGTYIYNAAPGAAGPKPPLYPGFQFGNTGVAFDGAGGGYVSVPALNINTNTVTITGWFNASGSQTAQTGVILNRSGTTIAGLAIDIAGGLALSYNWNDDPATINWASGVSLADSDWTYVALVIQPAQAALYAAFGTNFTTWTTGTNFTSHTPQAFEGPTLFGADLGFSPNRFFKGTINQVAIFNRALSEGELYTAYGSAIGGVAPQIFTDVAAPANPPYVGDSLNFTVDAGGTPSLGYQWRKGGTAVAGANSSTFTIASLKATDAGNYDVVITNAYGSVKSSVAAVTVQSPSMPAISQGPIGRTLYQGGFLNLSVVATGGQLQYQWQHAGTNITTATTSAYVVNSVTAADAGAYKVVVSNSLGSVSAGPVTVMVIVPGANTYEAAIVADSPEAWWRLDEPPGSTTMHDAMGRHDGTYVGSGITLGAAGAVTNGAPDTAASFDGSESFADVPYSQDLNSSEFTIEAWALLTDATAPRAILSSYDTSAFKGIFFWADPKGVSIGIPDGTWNNGVGLNDGTMFYYSPMGNISSGRWAHLASTFSFNDGQLNYLNGQVISGPFDDFVRNARFDFLIGGVGTNFPPPASGGPIGRWIGSIDEVAVYKYALTAQQLQNHYVQAIYGNNTKPVFITQPQAVLVASGGAASFSAQVEGSIPITYQWFKDGVAVPNATNNTLTFGKAAFANTGSYQLVAVNPAGSNASAAATLTVLPPPKGANATNALVLHLKFDGDYTDSSGRGNNGTPMGSPTFVAGQIGQAVHYSTTTTTGGSFGTVTNASYVTLGSPSDLLFGPSTSFSVAFWVKLPAGYANGDLPFFGSALNSANNQGFTFCPSYQTGGWQWDLEQIIGSTTNNVDVNGPDNSINDGQWHHFAATFDRSANVALTYLDGHQVSSDSIASLGAFDSTNTVSIGQDPTGLYPESGSAALDDLGVWHRVLAPVEIYAIYYSGAHFGAALDAYQGQVLLAVTSSGTHAVVVWQAGTLLQADTLAGPWIPVTGANPPAYTVTPGSGTKFYKVHL